MRIRDTGSDTSHWVLLLLAQLQALALVRVKYITLDIGLGHTNHLYCKTWYSIFKNLYLLTTRAIPDAGRVLQVRILHRGPVNFHEAMTTAYNPQSYVMHDLDINFIEIINRTV